MSNGFGRQIQNNVDAFGRSVSRDRAKELESYMEMLQQEQDDTIINLHQTYPSNIPIRQEMQRRGLFKDYGVR